MKHAQYKYSETSIKRTTSGPIQVSAYSGFQLTLAAAVGKSLGNLVVTLQIHNYVTKYGNRVPNLQTNFASSAPTFQL